MSILTVSKFGKPEFETKGGSAFSMIKPRKVSMGDGATKTQWEPVHVYRNATTFVLNHDGTTAPIPGAVYAVTGEAPRLVGKKEVTPKKGNPYTLPLYAVRNCGRMLQLKKVDGKWQLPTGELYEDQGEDIPANAATDVAVPAGADVIVPF